MRHPTLTRLAAGLLACALGMTGLALGAETGDLDRLREKALELVNMERRDQGLEPLMLDPVLNEAAQSHAEDMLARNYYAHASPEGETVMDRSVEAGGSRWRLTAENLARCEGCASPPDVGRIEELHEGWMNSPEHRENILREGLDRFGFGIIAGDGDERMLYAVQTFAGAGTSRGLQPQEEASAIDRQRQNALAAERLNRARRSENAPAVETDPALVEAAANLLPEQDLASSDPVRLGNPMEALPENARAEWRSLTAVMAACGGCGTEPNAADVRSFLQQWLDDPQYRDRLLSRDVTDIGFVIRANGEGLKRAVLVLGQHR